MPKLSLTLAAFAAIGLLSPSFAAERSAVAKQNAPQLLSDAQKALAFTVKAARTDQSLAATKPTAKPFLASLKKVGQALDGAEKGLAAKDATFFSNLDAARAAVAEMQVTWPLTKSKNADVIAGAKKLGGAVTVLQQNYGALAQRAKQGGELTAAEKARFKALKAQQLDLAKQAQSLAAKLKGDPALAAGLAEISRKAKRIGQAPETPSAFASAVDLLSTLAGLVAGFDYYVPAAERGAWKTLSSSRSAWYTPATYYDTVVYDWAITSTAVSVYESYDVAISSEEITSEESYLSETEFSMSEEEESEVSEESDEVEADDITADELESDDEEAADEEADDEMDADDSDDSADDSDDSADDSDNSSDDSDDSGDDSDDSGDDSDDSGDDSDNSGDDSDNSGDDSDNSGDDSDDSGDDSDDGGDDSGDDGGGDDGGSDE